MYCGKVAPKAHQPSQPLPYTSIMAAIHGPSIIALPTSLQAHLMPSSRMDFHAALAQPMVNFDWCHYYALGSDYSFQNSPTAQGTSGYSGRIEVRSILQVWDHSSPACSLHAFVLWWAASHFIWLKFKIYILHCTCSLLDESPLICGIWGSHTPPMSEDLFTHCPWLMWSTSVSCCFHDHIKSDLWWQILQ